MAIVQVLRLREVTMTENSLRFVGKILALVKLMALTIYAKAGLLRPRTKAKDFASRPRPRTNITGVTDISKRSVRRASQLSTDTSSSEAM